MAGLKGSSQKNGTAPLPRGQPALCSLAVLEGGTDVTPAPRTAPAACACEGARTGHSKIPQGEGKAPGIFKPQLLHRLCSRERP